MTQPEGRNPPHVRWSERENDVLRQYYPDGGAPGVRDLLPHRTDEAIRRQAANIGVKRLGKRYRNQYKPAGAIDFGVLVAKHCAPSPAPQRFTPQPDPPEPDPCGLGRAPARRALGPDALYQDWLAALNRVRHRLTTQEPRP